MQISEEVDKISGKTLTLVFTCLYLCFHSYALTSSSIQVCEQHRVFLGLDYWKIHYSTSGLEFLLALLHLSLYVCQCNV